MATILGGYDRNDGTQGNFKRITTTSSGTKTFLDVNAGNILGNTSKRIAYDVNNNPEFIGETTPGSGGNTSGLVWQIRKITYDINQNPITIFFANGTEAFDKAWDSRAGYSYS